MSGDVAVAVESDDDVPADDDRLPGVPERRVPGLSAKRLRLLELMVYEGMSRDEAAEAAGLTARAARYAMSDGRFLSVYRRALQGLRDSEKPKAIRRLAELRDQKESQRIAFEAARELQREPAGGPVINVGVGVGVNITPGYITSVGDVSKARHILARAGSVANVIDNREVER